MRDKRTLTYGWVVAVAVLVGACGADNSTSPSGSGVSLQGTVLSASGASGVSAQSTATTTSSARLVVTVQENPALSATVSANGTFSLENLPAGEFTLVFTSGGTLVGSITISGVVGGAEVKIVVQITPDGVILIEIHIGEIGEPSPSPSPNPSPSSSPTNGGSCMINGGRAGAGIELEGDVASGNNQSFKLSVNRASGLVSINASGAAYRCVGQSGSDCKANLKAGAKVHVRGVLTTCSASSALVNATEVKVQKP